MSERRKRVWPQLRLACWLPYLRQHKLHRRSLLKLPLLKLPLLKLPLFKLPLFKLPLFKLPLFKLWICLIPFWHTARSVKPTWSVAFLASRDARSCGAATTTVRHYHMDVH